GRIILVGTSGSPSRGTVERLTPNGILDAPFSSGYVSFYDAPFGSSPSYTTTFKRLFLDGGRPVIAGEAPFSTSANSDYDLVVTRLKTELIFANGFE
ncbi:MAG: hypothetical protein ABI304_10115, partial [Rudaea sp.]